MSRTRTAALALVMLISGVALAKDLVDRMPHANEVLPGRSTPMPLPPKHLIYGTPLDVTPEGMEVAYFSMGCFWGAEEHFFKTVGVLSTSVGYAGGATPNPTYDEVSTGRTGHAETVRVVYNPKLVSYDRLLAVFWEGHDPTQGMRQGNDTGTQYRSMLVTTTEAQKKAALASRDAYQGALKAAGKGAITTEIKDAPSVPFFFAEQYHQQYCYTNPTGYCGHGGTGVKFPR